MGHRENPGLNDLKKSAINPHRVTTARLSLVVHQPVSFSMAKDPRHQQNIIKRYYEHHETIQSNRLSEMVSELWLTDDEKTKVKIWGKVQVALMRMGVDATQVAKVVGKRDLEALARLVAQADAGTVPAPAPGEAKPRVQSLADGRTVGQMRQEKAAEGGYDSLEEANLKRALRAFRRKIKTYRRDDESSLGGRYVTMGRESDICAITPPKEFPMPVWEKLAELGRLKRTGQGTFQLP